MANKLFDDLIPVAPLRIIAMPNCMELGRRTDEYILKRRRDSLSDTDTTQLSTLGYRSDSYLIDYNLLRDSTGEGRAIINESVRGSDLFILADTVNYSQSFQIHGEDSAMSPDEHFADLKRLIMACSGHPHRITVIMPFLYEGRQNIRVVNESLDCALALHELTSMGVETIITFDAHDSRVQNAIPINGFDNFYTSYQFIKKILDTQPDLKVDNSHLMIVSPDEGGTNRAVYYATLLGVDMGMFYRRRDYSKTVDGEHPVVSFEFLGNDLYGKSVIIVDDMIATGKSVLEAARELKKRHAGKVYICATFGLFTEGLAEYDKFYEDGYFDYIYTTNLTYCPPELLDKPYYHNVDLSSYISLIIDTLNHDTSVNDILDATVRIQDLITERNRAL